jgi:predicted permease
VLLFGTLLLGRSLIGLLHTPAGFQVEGTLTFELRPPLWSYDADAAQRFQQQMVERLEQLPGVQAVGLVSDLPFTNWNNYVDIALPGDSRLPRESEQQSVNPQYFRSLGIPILEGRNFTASDRSDSAPVILVNQSLAALLPSAGNIVGRQLRIGQGEQAVDAEIIGVVGDILDDGLRGEREPRLYRPLSQSPRRWVSAVVRAPGSPAALSTAVLNVVRGLDSEVPVWNVRPLSSLVSASVSRERAALWGLSLFTALALLLAASGIYGVIAYSVTERRREMGIRSALGAAPAQLARSVLIESTRTTLAGVAVGCILALAAAGALRTLLFGVSRADPWSLAATITVLTAIALLAAWVPARRAARVQPVEALQDG